MTYPPQAADWPLDVCRYYMVDHITGSDANLGYIDGPLHRTFNREDFAGIALKTYEEFCERIPKDGAGRVVACKIFGYRVLPLRLMDVLKYRYVRLEGEYVEGFVR